MSYVFNPFSGTLDWTVTLPSQTGNVGKFLMTDGTVTSWSSVVTAVSIGNVLYVDKALGNDSTGKRNDFTKPFATVLAAIAAATAGDLIEIRPGAYTEAGIIFSKNLTITGYGAVFTVASDDTVIFSFSPATGKTVSLYGITASVTGDTTAGISVDSSNTISIIDCKITANDSSTGVGISAGNNCVVNIYSSTVTGGIDAVITSGTGTIFNIYNSTLADGVLSGGNDAIALGNSGNTANIYDSVFSGGINVASGSTINLFSCNSLGQRVFVGGTLNLYGGKIYSTTGSQIFSNTGTVNCYGVSFDYLPVGPALKGTYTVSNTAYTSAASLLVKTANIVPGYVDAQAVISNPTGAGVFRFEGQDYAKFEFKAIHASGTGIDSGAYQLYSRNDGSNPPVLHLGALNDAENSESPILEVFRTGTSVTDFHIYPNTSVDGNFIQVSISADTSGTVYLGDPQGIYNGTTFTVSDTNQWAVFDGQKVGIGLNPTALLNIKAGTTASGTAPLKFSSGSLMTSPEIGAVEYLTDLLYLTRTTGTSRLAILASQTGRLTAKTAAQTSVVTFTPPADGSFIVSSNVLVTTATLHNFTVTCAYTDEGNTSRTVTLNFSTIAGAITPTIANAGGAVPYEGVPLHIRAKASTSITIATTGTFTTVAYNVEGAITQIA